MELDNTEKRNRLFSSGMAEKDPTEKAGFAFTGGAVLTEELGDGAGQHRKAEPTDQTRQTDKNSPEKSGFDFLGDFVLAEELGGSALHQRPKLYLIS